MLKDADPGYFSGIYIVCGYTDLRYGIDSLASIIERKYHMQGKRELIIKEVPINSITDVMMRVDWKVTIFTHLSYLLLLEFNKILAIIKIPYNLTHSI